MAPVGAIQAEIGVRFNKKLFSHSCHEFKPRAVRAQALAAVACEGVSEARGLRWDITRA